MRKRMFLGVFLAVLAGCSHGGSSSGMLPAGVTPPMTPQSVSPGTITAPPMAQTTILPSSAMQSPPRSSIAQPPLNWSQIAGTASAVAAAPDGSLWVLSDQPSGADKYIWHYTGSWTNISGLASSLTVASDGSIWAINSAGGIYHYVSGTWSSPGGGASNSITADPSGGVYVLSNGGAGPDRAIWHYSSGTGWVQQSGSGTALAANWDTNNFSATGAGGSGTINAGGVYILNSAGGIWYENSDFSFARLPGSASAISPTTNGGVFALGYPSSPSGNQVYYYDLNTPGWTGQNGAGLASISAGSSLYLTSSSGSIYTAALPATGPVATVSMTVASLPYTTVTLGSSRTITITVAEKDVNGKTMSGTYANPITLQNLDPNYTTLNTTSVPSSSTTVTLTYNGSTQFAGTRIRAFINSNTLLAGSFLVVGPCPLGAGVSRLGYYPCDLLSAYALASSSAANGGTQTVAIVDAYDDPTAESDLAIYRSAFGLSACTTANGCFKKRAQDGSTNYPIGDAGWAGEISLDLDMVSAVCPNCKILLVEANTNSGTNLYTAENRAATLGATEISNSWGGSEYGGENLDDATYFNHPGIPITVSTGDAGFPDGVEFPSSSQYVTAVGGTTLIATSGGRGWSESAWGQGSVNNGGAGSGCSSFIIKPAWQLDTGCGKRMVADVSAVADPATAVWTYDTYQSAGWGRVGGTSAAAPIIASVYAISGNASSVTYGSYPYAHTGSLNDVTSGNNSFSMGCSPNPDYFCTAEVGYDGPTGLGTPNGATGAFIRPEGWSGPAILNSLNYHPGPTRALCPDEFRPGYARCFAIIRTD
jgi:subtilase family serine protease